jgi:hypothetical protein
MFMLRNKLLAVAAALTLGALLAPRPAAASIASFDDLVATTGQLVTLGFAETIKGGKVQP